MFGPSCIETKINLILFNPFWQSEPFQAFQRRRNKPSLTNNVLHFVVFALVCIHSSYGCSFGPSRQTCCLQNHIIVAMRFLGLVNQAQVLANALAKRASLSERASSTRVQAKRPNNNIVRELARTLFLLIPSCSLEKENNFLYLPLLTN